MTAIDSIYSWLQKEHLGVAPFKLILLYPVL